LRIWKIREQYSATALSLTFISPAPRDIARSRPSKGAHQGPVS